MSIMFQGVLTADVAQTDVWVDSFLSWHSETLSQGSVMLLEQKMSLSPLAR